MGLGYGAAMDAREVTEFYGNFPQKPAHDGDRDSEQEENDGESLLHASLPGCPAASREMPADAMRTLTS